MVHQPGDEEIEALESAAPGNPDALRAFDGYIEALSILFAAQDEDELPNLRDFEVAVGMVRCEVDFQLGRFI